MALLPPNVVATVNSRPIYQIEESPRIAFRYEMLGAGFKPPNLITIGKLIRMDGPDDRKGRESGWCIYHEWESENHVFGVGVYGSWKGKPEKVTWCSRSTAAMTSYDRDVYNSELAKIKEKREAAQKEAQQDAAKKAFEIWSANGVGDHPYLDRKGVALADGIKVGRGCLIIPITDADGLTSLQFIDDKGGKKFLTAGKVKGGWFKIAGDDDIVYVCEGYATGMSLRESTGSTVYVAFNAGNLYEVACAIKPLYMHIIIAGDDDEIGRTKATQAGAALTMEVVYPGVPYNDFNDMYLDLGPEEVRVHLAVRPKVYQTKVESDVMGAADISSPPGILGDVFSYYNATSGNHQPGFAVQTALALGSIVCGRSFETNYDNRSALFLMNLGKSGTGKEHIKRVLERILEEAGCGSLFAGDGYTSKGGVFSALYDKPRHITVIDEFSKYMASAGNRNSSGMLVEANTELMKIIAAPNGIHRAPNYSTIGMPNDKKKEIIDLKIINPHITMVAMSTPEDLLNNINITAVKDGFYNRFVIYISDAPRVVREHKEWLEVPDTILNWIRAINLRRGVSMESPMDYPRLITLRMSAGAVVVARELEEYKVKRANELERFSLADLPARIAEMAQRIAMILALARNPMTEIVEESDMRWAGDWVKFNHIVLTNRMKMSVSSSDYESRKLESLGYIRAAGEDGVSKREMMITKPFSKYNARELGEVLAALVEAELVEVRARKTGKPGKPVMAWVGVE